MDRPSIHWPWFVPVFALYPVLHVAANNPGETETGTVLLVAVVVVAAAMLFFSYGIVCQWAEDLVKLPDSRDFALMNEDPGFQFYLSVAWALLLVLGVMLARRLPLNARRASITLNLFAAILLAMVAARW